MKKAVAVFALLAMILPLFTACRSVDLTLSFEPLSDEAKALINDRVERDWERKVDWDGTGWYEPYYGTINGFAVVQASKGYLYNNSGYTGVAGYGFKAEGYLFELYAYRDGLVCTLQEAYANDWLTKEQIGIIHERHQEIHAEWLRYGGRFDPDSYYDEELSEEKKTEYAQLIFEKYGKEIAWKDCAYSGIINDCAVFMIVNYAAVYPLGLHIEVGNQIFSWHTKGFQIYVCHDGAVCKLTEAYEEGWLTDYHLMKIWNAHVKKECA